MSSERPHQPLPASILTSSNKRVACSRMADFAKLLEGGERQHVERKGPMAFEGEHRLELAKDNRAMANTRDGGTILIGVSEDRQSGTWRKDGLSAGQARTFDVTKVHDFVKERAAPPVKLAVEAIEH